MYECPASIAPEPNNYEFISSRSIFFLLASRTEDSFLLCQPAACCHFLREKFTFHKETQKPLYLVLHVSLASVIVVFIYSGVCGASPQPLLLIVCQSSPEAEGRRPPLPFQTAAGRQPKQKALSANHRAAYLSTLERNQSELPGGGADAELQIQLNHFLVVFSSDSEPVPMATALFQL